VYLVVVYRRNYPKGWWFYPAMTHAEALAWAYAVTQEGDHAHIQSDPRWN
jgi:hypothetical protein